MNYRHLLTSLFVPVVLLTSGCSQPLKPFDIKGVWEATKGECGNYCRFIVSDKIEKEKPTKLYIIFNTDGRGESSTAYSFYPSKNKNKDDEWVFEAISGYGYLYLRDNKLVSMAGITYKKVSSETFGPITQEKK